MRCFYRKVARAAGSRPAPRPLSAPPPPVPLRPAPPNPPRLPRPRRAQPDQFQQREEGHDQLGAGALAPDHRREEERPGVAEEGEDLAHPLEGGERVRLHLAWRLAPRLLQQAPEGALQEVDAQILERDLLRRRQ